MVEVEHSSFVLLYAKLDFTKTYVKLKEMTCVADSFISTNYSFCFAIFYTDCNTVATLTEAELAKKASTASAISHYFY